MNNEVIKWLVGTPASDMKFQTNLKRATAAEIRETLKILEGRREVKTKEKALRAEATEKGKMKGDRHTMKSLILTTQDARELDKLGGLTITKPIKPAPRYIAGASFSRDADCADIWHLVGQDGNRLGAGDGVADVFASPVEVSDVCIYPRALVSPQEPAGRRVRARDPGRRLRRKAGTGRL